MSRYPFIQEDVLRFDVPVQNPPLMRILDRLGNRFDPLRRLCRFQRFGSDFFRKVGTLRIIHGEVVPAFMFAHLVDGPMFGEFSAAVWAEFFQSRVHGWCVSFYP